MSSKNQITLPVDALRKAGLRPGDELVVERAEAGRITLSRTTDPLLKYAGALTGVYPRGYLRRLRAEWR